MTFFIPLLIIFSLMGVPPWGALLRPFTFEGYSVGLTIQVIGVVAIILTVFFFWYNNVRNQ